MAVESISNETSAEKNVKSDQINGQEMIKTNEEGEVLRVFSIRDLHKICYIKNEKLCYLFG